jgi:hypothetical protein
MMYVQGNSFFQVHDRPTSHACQTLQEVCTLRGVDAGGRISRNDFANVISMLLCLKPIGSCILILG